MIGPVENIELVRPLPPQAVKGGYLTHASHSHSMLYTRSAPRVNLAIKLVQASTARLYYGRRLRFHVLQRVLLSTCMRRLVCLCLFMLHPAA